MIPPEPSYPTLERPECPDTAEAQESDIKIHYEMIEVLKEEINVSLRETEVKMGGNGGN